MNNVIFPGRTISPQGRVIYVASPIKAYILNYEWKKSQGGCLDLQNYFCKKHIKAQDAANHSNNMWAKKDDG